MMFVIYTVSTEFFKLTYIKDAIFEYYFFAYIIPQALGLLILTNLFYLFLYYNKFPSIEKLKSNNLPWPWEEDSVRFWKEFPSYIWTYLSNQFILMPLFFALVFRFYVIR